MPYYTGKKQYELTNHLGNVLATITDKKIGVSLASDSSLIDHYEADVQTAQDYYPFGMIMPGRMFTALAIPGGSVAGTTNVNGYALPVDLTLSRRTADKPSEYVATQYIDLTEGFESGDSTDMMTAYIADTSYAGTGNGGFGPDGVAGAGKYRYGFNGKEQDNEVKGVGDQLNYGARIYDPRSGRFLSVDPISRDFPELSTYQYASNSPIAFVDIDGLEMGYKTADGTVYYPPPSDHLRTPVPSTWNLVDVPKGKGLSDESLTTIFNLIPAVNEVKGIDEARTGKEWFTGRQLSTVERVLSVIPYLGKAKRIEGTIVKATENEIEKDIVQNTEKAIVKSEKAIESTENAIVKTEKQNNKIVGNLREAAEKVQLEKENPGATVLAERYLRDKDGKIVKDPVTGTGRRVDFAVIKDGKVVDMVETTSQTANKTSQAAKEERIRNAGGTYIRDSKTKKLFEVKDVPTKTNRRD